VKITHMTNRIAVALILFSGLLSVSHYAGAQDATEVNRKIVAKVQPQYPALARPLKIQGNVRAEVLVAPDGKVKSVDVRGGHPLLVQSAEQALRQWKWEPASRETHEEIELKFAP